MKEDLETAQSSRGFLTSLGNSISEVFGGGDKKTETKIEEYEELIEGLNGDNAAEIYKEITGEDLTSEITSALEEADEYVNSLDEQTYQALVEILQNLVDSEEEAFNSTKENNGIIAKGWDAVKNATGLGASSNKTQSQIDKLKDELEALENGEVELAAVYKDVTGNELTEDEVNSLIDGSADFSDSDVVNSVSKYQQGQTQAVNTISSVASGIAVMGCIAAAPFTGGLSLAGISLGTAALAVGAGTAAYMVPQVIDGVTEKDGYSAKEIAQDIATGAVNSAFMTIGAGAGKAVGSALTSKLAASAAETGTELVVSGGTETAVTAAGTASQNALSGSATKLVQLAASETTSVIMGDGIAIGDYLIEVAANDDVDFSLETLGETAASATAASLAAGAAAVGTSGLVRGTLTSGQTASSQIAGRLASSGLSGAAAGSAATAAAGATSYLINCAQGEEDFSAGDLADAATENLAQGALTGFVAGVGFEAVQIAVGTPAPEGTTETKKGTKTTSTGEELSYKEYLDKDGNVISRQYNADDVNNFVKNGGDITELADLEISQNKVSITQNKITATNEYGDEVSLVRNEGETSASVNSEALNSNTARVVRFNYNTNSGTLDGTNVNVTQVTSDGGVVIDWADSAIGYAGSNARYEYLSADKTTAGSSAQTANSLQLTGTQAQISSNSQGALVETGGNLPQTLSQGGNNLTVSNGYLTQGETSLTTGASGEIAAQTTSALASGASGVLAQTNTGLNAGASTSVTNSAYNSASTEEISTKAMKGMLEEAGVDSRMARVISNETPDRTQTKAELLAEAKQAGASDQDILDMCDMSEESIKSVVDLINEGTGAREAINTVYGAESEAEQAQNMNTLLEAGVNSDTAYSIAYSDGMTQEKINLLVEANKAGFDALDLLDFANMDNESIQFAIDTVYDGASTLEAKTLAEEYAQNQSDWSKNISQTAEQTEEAAAQTTIAEDTADLTETYQKALEEAGIDSYAAKKIACLEGMTEEKTEALIHLRQAGMDPYSISDYAILETEQIENMADLMDAGIDYYYARRIANLENLTEEKISALIKINQLGVNEYNLGIYATSMNTEQLEMMADFLEAGIHEAYANAMSENSDMTEEKANALMEAKQAGADDYVLYSLLKESTDYIKSAAKLISAGINSDYEIRDICAKYQGEMFDSFIELYKEGLSQSEISTILSKGSAADFLEAVEELESEGVNRKVAVAGVAKNVDFSSESTMEMAKVLSDENYEANIKKAVSNPNLQEAMAQITDISGMSTDDISNLLTSGLSEDEFYGAVKQLSKSLKLAMKTPNQYLSDIPVEYTTKVNGKYPTLDEETKTEYQGQITEFFQENFTSLVKASNYLDSDTVNQMMDRRTTIFAQSLGELDNLTTENYELLSELTSCKSTDRGGKSLTAREKVQLTQIVEIFQKGGIDTTSLSEMAKSGSVSLSQAKQQIQKEILSRAGISEADLSEIPEEKLSFNQEYSYLALTDENAVDMEEAETYIKEGITQIRQMSESERAELIKEQEKQINMALSSGISKEAIELFEKLNEMYLHIENYTDEEIMQVFIKSVEAANAKFTSKDELYTVIRESALGDFSEFITDESNIYGQTNAKTKAAFEEAGLDYEQWLDPDVEDVELEVAGKEMTIKMWERNPQEDLFMGNKTTCCTAIGTGGNAAATPVYLLNTSYNVVELYDSNGEVVGMSRVFMAEVNGENSIIMDNIELNSTYVKGMTDEEKTEIRNGFFTYMKEYAKQVTGNSEAPVYFYSGDVHVPTGDLELVNITADFIGSLSQDSIYVNSAGCSWIDVTRLKERGDISFLVVP